jgi:hypothetical protein
LCCLCGNERIVGHDMLWNTVVAIALDNGTHVQRKVFHLFPTTNENKWILSSLKTIFVPWWMLSLPIRLV